MHLATKIGADKNLIGYFIIFKCNVIVFFSFHSDSVSQVCYNMIMYNPANLHECEKEVKKKDHRQWDDRVMLFVGVIASLSSAPQVFKIFQTREVSDISFTAYIISLLSVIAWFVYGVHIKNKPLAVTTFISILILGTVVLQIFIYN